MAKRSGKDKSGVSMLALVRQVLTDGKVHTAKQIAEHMQTYMFKGIAVEQILGSVQNLLDNHCQVEKTAKGYRLKGGGNLTDLVRELLEEALLPLSEKEITKLVAKKQNVPADMIRLDLDSDTKITSVGYKSKKFYYLATRKNVNEKVYKILKKHNKIMSLEDIYAELELSPRIKRSKIIFLPREDDRIKKTGNNYGLKVKKKPKKAPAQPRHLISRREMDKVVDYLQSVDESFTADELSEKILGRQLKETNLRFKLARDRRLKRDDDRFYFETKEEETQIPAKVTERVETEFYKVKARMMGSTEIQSVNKLLDRIYGVNMAHQEVSFYQKELEENLMNDEDSILLLDNGWVHQNNEPRVNWILPEEYSLAILPDPLPPLQKEKITEEENRFLEYELNAVSADSEKTLVLQVSPIDRFNGIINVKDKIEEGFPSRPHGYELLLLFPEKDISYEAFMLRDEGLIRGLESLFADEMPMEGGIVFLTPSDENPYKFVCKIEQNKEPVDLNPDRVKMVREKLNTSRNLAELIRQLFESTKDKFLSCYQIWAEINLVRQVARRDVLATLKDYNCFLPIKSMDAYYSFDKSAGSRRLSVGVEIEKPVAKPVEQIKKPVEAEIVETVETEKVKEAVPAVSEEKSKKVKKSKVKSKKEAAKKRRKDPAEQAEELPEHLLKLQGFERKLPKLKTIRTEKVRSQVIPKPVSRSKRIGPVSAGKHKRSAFRKPVSTVESKLSLLPIPPMPKSMIDWDITNFVNPDRGKGYADLHVTLEVLNTFVSREPQVRRDDGSIVVFLDKNDLAIYFRIPPENQDCWLAWIPIVSLQAVNKYEEWLVEGTNKAKKSDDGYWWSTGKFKGPKGNFRDNNVLEGVEIVGKLIALMEKRKK